MAKTFMHIKKGISLRPISSPPSDPLNGDFYYDSTNGLQVYHNGSWQDVGAGAGGGSGGLEIENISSNTNATVGKHYKTDSSIGGAFSITLPDPTGLSAQDLLFARIMIQDDALACGSLGQEVTVIPHSGGTIRNSQGTLAVDETVVMDVQGIWLEYTWNPDDSVWMQRDIFIAAANGQAEVQIPKIGPLFTKDLEASDFENIDVITPTGRLTMQQNGESLILTISAFLSGSETNVNPFRLAIPNYEGNSMIPLAGEYGGVSLGNIATERETVSAYLIGDGVNNYVEFSQQNAPTTPLASSLFGTAGGGTYKELIATVTLPVTAFSGSGAYDTVTLQVPTPASTTIQIPRVTEPTVQLVPFASGVKGGTTQDKLVWRQVGAYMEGEIYYQQTSGGSAGSGDLRVTLPNGYTINGAATVIYDGLPASVDDYKFTLGQGRYSPSAGGTGQSTLSVIARSSTELGFVSLTGSTDTQDVLQSNVLGNANATIAVTFRVPITDFAGANAYDEVTVPIEGGSSGSGGGGTNYILNSNAEENTNNTSNTTRQTTNPLKGAAHFEVASGQTGIWQTQNFDSYVVDNSIALGVYGLVELAVGGTGRVYIHDGTSEVAGTSYDLVPGLNSLAFNFVPTAVSGYTLRLESTSGLIKADELEITDRPPAVGAAGGWKEYDLSTVTVTPASGTALNPHGSFVPYKDPTSGKWRLRFNYSADMSGVGNGTSFAVDISGITFKTTAANINWAVTWSTNFSDPDNLPGYAIQGTSTVRVDSATTKNFSTRWYMSGDVPLDSKPTWADFDGSVSILNRSMTQRTARAKFYRSSNLSYTTTTPVAFDAESSAIKASGVTNSSGTLTISSAGTYRVTAFISRDSGTFSLGNGRLSLYKNGSFVTRMASEVGSDSVSGTAMIDLTPSDNFDVRISSSFTIQGAEETSYIEIEQTSESSVVPPAGVIEATPINLGLVYKNRILQNETSSSYTTSTSGILSKTSIPDGTYKLTVGADYFYSNNVDQECYIKPQVNNSDVLLPGSTPWTIGIDDDSGTSFENYIRGMSSTRIITLSNGINSLDLDIIITSISSATVAKPWYILEKIENAKTITTEWD